MPPIDPAAPDSSLVVKALDLISAAMMEINVSAAGEQVSAEDGKWGLEKLQRLFDLFNAKRSLIYNVNFQRFTLKTNQAVHTIGPGQPDAVDFVLSARPVNVMSWALILPGEVEIPRSLRDEDWWAAQSLKALTSTLPTSLYYSPDFPLGSLYFWPIPTVANDVRLQLWTNLDQPTKLDSVIAMPPAYWDAIVLSLAVRLCPSFGKEASATLLLSQQQAMKAVIGNNAMSPRITTDGAGLSGGKGRSDFNFLTGERG